jgi:hypothetical protein
LWHHHIEYYQVRAQVKEAAQPLHAVDGGMDLIARPLQIDGQGTHQSGVIVDQQQFRFGAHSFLRASANGGENHAAADG